MIDKYEFADSLGGVREFFVDEAIKGSEEMKNTVVTKITVAAACVTLAAAAGLMAFFLGRGGIVTPANTDGQTEPQTSETSSFVETVPDTVSVETEPTETEPPVIETEEDAVELAYRTLSEIWPYCMTCPYTCESSGTAYTVTIGDSYTRVYRVSVDAQSGTASADLEKDAEPVPNTKVTPSMFESRKTVIAADIVFAPDTIAPFFDDSDPRRVGFDYIENTLITAYSECHYPGETIKEIRFGDIFFFDVYKRSREVRGDDGINAIAVVCEYAEYESGTVRAIDVIYVVDGPMCRLTGIEERSVGRDCYKTDEALVSLREYVSEDSRFAGRLHATNLTSVPDPGDGADGIVSEASLIDQSGVRELIGGEKLPLTELSVIDMNPGTAPGTVKVVIRADTEVFGSEDDTASSFYSFVYDLRTGKSADAAKVIDTAEYPYKKREWTGVEYDCARFTLYYDDKHDLRIRFKDTGRDELVHGNVSAEESVETQSDADLTEFNEAVTVWRDKKLIFELSYYEDIGGFVIYDVDTGETFESADTKYAMRLHGVVGKYAVLARDREFYHSLSDRDDPYDEFLIYYDLETGEIKTFDALSNALRTEAVRAGVETYAAGCCVSGNGRFFAVILGENGGPTSHAHAVVFDTETGKYSSFVSSGEEGSYARQESDAISAVSDDGIMLAEVLRYSSHIGQYFVKFHI